MSNWEKAVYAALAMAAIYFVFAWSTSSGDVSWWEAPRVAMVISGISLVLWNLVPDANETPIDTKPRSRRWRQLVFGIAVAAAAIFSPLPFGSRSGIGWQNPFSGVCLPNWISEGNELPDSSPPAKPPGPADARWLCRRSTSEL